MNISYNWLKTIIDVDLPMEELESYLTNCGLEVEKIAVLKPGNGGLDGLVVGQVVDKQKHPNADRLSVTKVSIGTDELLPIVCGAPNVEKGQKVVVAPVGTMLKPNEGGEFKIKEAKIRGELSKGMICAEDEIGLGNDHDGIMVLDDSATVGTALTDFLNLKDDINIEIGLTPNRGDATSHFGVARDLKALLKKDVKFPDTSYQSKSIKNPIAVSVENTDACPRYSGLFIDGVTVGESPMWLQSALKSIGISSTNNVVDVTNFVLHELGQPIHAFDANEIGGDEIIVRNATKGEKITTLDGVERDLQNDELLICDADKPLALAGVLGGLHSGITEKTKSVFIESAYFDPAVVRKTAKKHGISTDASFRYERGCDPDITVNAMHRIAKLIQEVAGGEISEEIIDNYPKQIEPFSIDFNTKWFAEFCGIQIDDSRIIEILQSLEIEIAEQDGADLKLLVPAYRSDVQRAVDVAEDVLRIYGYNEVPMPDGIKIPSNKVYKSINYEWKEIAANHLASMGWTEIQRDSQTKEDYYSAEELKDAVVLLNPLGPDHAVMRKELLYTALESVAFNKNRKASSILFYEFGKRYSKTENGYKEKEMLLLMGNGQTSPSNWTTKANKVSFAYIKGAIESTFARLGLDCKAKENRALYEVKLVPNKLLKKFGIKGEVWYAEMDWSKILKRIKKSAFVLREIPKFPEVIRDLSLTLDVDRRFEEVEAIAKKAIGKYLSDVELFDVYQGDQLEEGKKSYAIRFTMYNPERTMSDKEIEKLSQKLITSIEKEIGASVRS